MGHYYKYKVEEYNGISELPTFVYYYNTRKEALEHKKLAGKNLILKIVKI